MLFKPCLRVCVFPSSWCHSVAAHWSISSFLSWQREYRVLCCSTQFSERSAGAWWAIQGTLDHNELLFLSPFVQLPLSFICFVAFTSELKHIYWKRSLYQLKRSWVGGTGDQSVNTSFLYPCSLLTFLTLMNHRKRMMISAGCWRKMFECEMCWTPKGLHLSLRRGQTSIIQRPQVFFTPYIIQRTRLHFLLCCFLKPTQQTLQTQLLLGSFTDFLGNIPIISPPFSANYFVSSSIWM